MYSSKLRAPSSSFKLFIASGFHARYELLLVLSCRLLLPVCSRKLRNASGLFVKIVYCFPCRVIVLLFSRCDASYKFVFVKDHKLMLHTTPKDTGVT